MKNQTIRLLPTLFLLTMAWNIKAQDSSYTFSLEEAKARAVEHNYQAQIAAKNVEQSERKVKETIATGLPQVYGAASYQKYIETPVQLIPASAFGGPEGEFQEVFFGTEQQMSANITAQQLIFDGSYFVGLQATKVYLELSKNEAAKTEIEIKNMVNKTYGNVLVAERNVSILKGNVENLEKILFETEELYKNGFVEEQDRDQTQLLLSTTENAYDFAKSQLKVIQNQMKYILGLPVESNITLSDPLESLTNEAKAGDILAKDFSLDQHIEYKSILAQERATELLWKQKKSTYYPSLTAFYTYQRNSFANEFNFFSSDARWFPAQLVGLNLSVPIFTSFNKHHQNQQARIDYEKVQIARKQVEEQLKIQVENARSNYEFALRQYEKENSNLSLAERIYDKVETKYKEGVSSSMDLAQANNQLLAAQNDFIKASIELINSKVNLDQALNNY